MGEGWGEGDGVRVIRHHAAMTTPQRDFARELRRRQTSTEDLLWQQLRGRRLGHKFRRQVPVGRYTVDFLCFAAKLVIEIDGAQHAATAEYDAARTAEIEAQGLRVIRFTNREIRERLDDVLLRIAAALRRE